MAGKPIARPLGGGERFPSAIVQVVLSPDVDDAGPTILQTDEVVRGVTAALRAVVPVAPERLGRDRRDLRIGVQQQQAVALQP
jgi:hypothetical protein